MTTLLPPNATAVEAALASATARLADVPAPIPALWDPATCPAALLPWLAWALSVDAWDAGWTDETKRRVIAASVATHRLKGTVGAVKRAVAVAGYGDATVVERFGLKNYDGTIPRNGTRTREPQDHWAEYRVILTRPITIEQAEIVRRLLNTIAPVRCSLKAMSYLRALNTYDGSVPRDGSYSRGVA